MGQDAVEMLVWIGRCFGVFERDFVCGGTDVTVPQCLVLQALRAGPATASFLAQRTGGTLSAMTRLVDGLERRGWVKRERDPQDRRKLQIALSVEGVAKADFLHGEMERVLSHVMAQIPAQEQPQVLAALSRLRDAMEASESILRSCCADDRNKEVK